MERFYFEKPSLKRKEEIIAFLQEFEKAGSEINGSGSLDRVLHGFPFEEALDRCLSMENKVFAENIGRCPVKTFLLIRENDDKIIGTINVRWDLNEEMLKFGGHIGYGIRPSERRKGYNKINLYLGLKEAKKLGLTKVMLGCGVLNAGSNGTILALGGKLDRCELDPEDGRLTNVYWIDVDDSLKENHALYEEKVISNE